MSDISRKNVITLRFDRKGGVVFISAHDHMDAHSDSMLYLGA